MHGFLSLLVAPGVGLKKSLATLRCCRTGVPMFISEPPGENLAYLLVGMAVFRFNDNYLAELYFTE